ncbi:MAG: ATP-dependent RNA helicase HrpA [Candidatus Protistobacter heckmanni]|nr:ATP-dependent RNA helicase HrpA [Candidatus Protistobacter heckmanni]
MPERTKDSRPAQQALCRPAAPVNPIPELSFPEALPVSGRREDIARALRASQVLIVCGETGSGKTTQLPKICLSIGRGLGAGGAGLIGHTQPRRLAATSTAKRIAQELGTPLGEHVGFKIRFNDNLSSGASVKLMTDGILLAETQSDPLLRAYDTLIIDEAHERSLNIDFLLGYLKQMLPQRPDLKLIITSATIDAERFAQHFALPAKNAEGREEMLPAPVIEVSGRLYPVELRYRPVIQARPGGADAAKSKKDSERDLYDAIVDAVDELVQTDRGKGGDPGDVLVFLPGEREIREAAEALRKHHPQHTEILPLFARLSAQEQEKIFKLGNARRIVLATNMAETSLTVPGIRYVVDTGLARVKRYSYRNKVEQLQIESIAQAQANQRAGRCGRVADGICIRLYEESDFLGRPAFPNPEIMRSSLASVILRMKSLGLPDVVAFPFVDPPNGRAVADGYQLLQELGAVEEAAQKGASPALTPLGKKLARLPVDPRVGRMLLAGVEQGCLREMLIIAAALSVQDPRDRPMDQQATADAAHREFADEKSEFQSYLKIWNWFEEAVKHKKSNRQLLDLCRSKFLSQLRLREWRDIHAQLHALAGEQGWRENATPPTYQQLHQALLTGLLGNIGCKVDDELHYLGARGIKFFPWPGSSLARKAGRWLIAAELVETSRLFGRTLARIEPEWLEKIGAHLLKVSHSDPHWEKKAGQVLAAERATLYGLTVYQGRRVNFGQLDPKQAREIFIRRALVEGELGTRLPFFQHNAKLIREIENLEHKSRRQDVLVDDELIFAFYDQQLPETIVSAVDLESWWKEASRGDAKLLHLDREDLMRHQAAGITTDLFPKMLSMAGARMKLAYHFEPGSPRDGVTLAVPAAALNLIDAARCDWLVPGMLKEKAAALLKSLPQKLRRHCVPLPNYALGFCERMGYVQKQPGQDVIDALIADIRAEKQTQVKRSDFKPELLAAHMQMNFKVVDEHERQLDLGRNLAQLRGALAGQRGGQAGAQAGAQTGAPVGGYAGGHAAGQSGQAAGASAAGLVHDNPEQASAALKQNLRQRFAGEMREQVKYLEKNIPGLSQMVMLYLPLGGQEELVAQIVGAAIERAFLRDPLPEDDKAFAKRKDEGKGRLNLLAQEIARTALAILTEHAAVAKKLPQAKPQAAAYADLQAQLKALVARDFIAATPETQLAHLPRYLKGMALRIDKLRTEPGRDAPRMAEFAPLQQGWQRAAQQLRTRGVGDPKLEEFRWMLEELRISLYAQELRTPMPVSAKRLHKAWKSLGY